MTETLLCQVFAGGTVKENITLFAPEAPFFLHPLQFLRTTSPLDPDPFPSFITKLRVTVESSQDANKIFPRGYAKPYHFARKVFFLI